MPFGIPLDSSLPIARYDYYDGPFAESVRYFSSGTTWDLTLIESFGIPQGPTLDVGAGWGRVVASLVDKSKDVWAVEQSRSFVKSLEAMADDYSSSKRDIATLTVVPGDISLANLPSSYFSAIYIADLTVNAFQSTEDLSHIFTVLKPLLSRDGYIALFAFRDESDRKMFEKYQDQLFLCPFKNEAGETQIQFASLRFDPVSSQLHEEYLIPQVIDGRLSYALATLTEHIWIESEIINIAKAGGFTCNPVGESRIAGGGLDGAAVGMIICTPVRRRPLGEVAL